jgi:hypothetical protein
VIFGVCASDQMLQLRAHDLGTTDLVRIISRA